MATLLELGAGFHPDLTGRENVFLNAAILGIPREDVRKRFDQIADFVIALLLCAYIGVGAGGDFFRRAKKLTQGNQAVADQVAADKKSDEKCNRQC